MGEMVGMGRLAPRLILMLRMIGHRRIFGPIPIPIPIPILSNQQPSMIRHIPRPNNIIHIPRRIDPMTIGAAPEPPVQSSDGGDGGDGKTSTEVDLDAEDPIPILSNQQPSMIRHIPRPNNIIHIPRRIDPKIRSGYVTIGAAPEPPVQSSDGGDGGDGKTSTEVDLDASRLALTSSYAAGRKR
jgi:hypothetical protein